MIPRLIVIVFSLCAFLNAQGQWSSPIDWGFTATDMTVLPNGKVLAWPKGTTGLASTSARVFDPANGSVTAVTNSTTNLYCSAHVLNHKGRVFTLGGDGGTPNTNFFDSRFNLWGLGDSASSRACARAITIPSGETAGSLGDSVLNAWQGTIGRQIRSNSLAPAGWTYWLYDGRLFSFNVSQVYFGNLDSNTFNNCFNESHANGTSALVTPNRLLVIGGGPSGNQNRVLSLNTDSFSGSNCNGNSVTFMNASRTWPNATILADGSVLISGGSSTTSYSQRVLAGELFYPSTNSFTPAASMQTGRLGDSSAVLLPDGRVLVAGGIDDSGSHTDYEIYSPPYVFDSSRPTITSAPTRIGYLQKFDVGTTGSGIVTGAALIGLSSTSGGFNAGQRYVSLVASANGTGVTVQGPLDENLCPPGYYILVVLTNTGVPSAGRIVLVEPRDRIGTYNPSTVTFDLRLSNTSGVPDLSVPYGTTGDVPLVGDWDGDHVTTIAIKRGNVFWLRNSNTAGNGDVSVTFGDSSDIPLAGDWNGTGYSKIGVYKPSLNRFDLRLTNTTGPADISVTYGGAGDLPVVGDWDGDGTTTIGIYRPSDQKFYLRNSNTPGAPDLVLQITPPGFVAYTPIVGDWDGDGKTDVGYYVDSIATFKLQTQSNLLRTVVFGTANQGRKPIAGDWDARAVAGDPPTGSFDVAYNNSIPNSTSIGQSGTAYFAGWAADSEDGVSINRVELRISGNGLTNYLISPNATLGVLRNDVASGTGHPEWANSGWYLNWATTPLSPGTYTVSATAWDTSSLRSSLPSSKTITITANTAPFGNLDVAWEKTSHSSSISRATGTLLAGGWSADSESGSPLTVSLFIDNVNVTANATKTTAQRPDVVSAFSRQDYLNSGFNFELAGSALSLGTHTAKVTSVDAMGTVWTSNSITFSIVP